MGLGLAQRKSWGKRIRRSRDRHSTIISFACSSAKPCRREGNEIVCCVYSHTVPCQEETVVFKKPVPATRHEDELLGLRSDGLGLLMSKWGWAPLPKMDEGCPAKAQKACQGALNSLTSALQLLLESHPPLARQVC